MALYSDQILEPKSAKSRILSSIRRKVDNSTLSTEIYEEVRFHEFLCRTYMHYIYEIFIYKIAISFTKFFFDLPG